MNWKDRIIRFFTKYYCEHPRTSEIPKHNHGWTSDSEHNYPAHFGIICNTCGKEIGSFIEHANGRIEKPKRKW